MGKVSFTLTHKDNEDEPVFLAKSLKEIYPMIMKMTPKETKDYTINQIENGEVVDVCHGTFFFLEYKDLEQIPELISDIDEY